MRLHMRLMSGTMRLLIQDMTSTIQVLVAVLATSHRWFGQARQSLAAASLASTSLVVTARKVTCKDSLSRMCPVFSLMTAQTLLTVPMAPPLQLQPKFNSCLIPMQVSSVFLVHLVGIAKLIQQWSMVPDSVASGLHAALTQPRLQEFSTLPQFPTGTRLLTTATMFCSQSLIQIPMA